MMRTTIKTVVLCLATAASLNAAAESFGIANDRLSSAIEDNSLNDNKGTHERVNAAYNDAKQAEGGSMDISKAPMPAGITAQPVADTSATAHPDYSAEATHAHYQALAARRQQLIDAKIAKDSEASAAAASAVRAAKDAAMKQAQIIADHQKFQVLSTLKEQRIEAYQAQQIAARNAYVSAVTAANPAQTASINVAVKSLAAKAPHMAVTAAIEGVQVTTTAEALATVAPETQVAVPHIAALIQRAGNAGNGYSAHSQLHQGDNNGGSNAHANAMGGHGQGGMRSGSSAANNF